MRRPSSVPRSSQYTRLAAAWSFLLWPLLSLSQPPAHSVLCRDGNGNYDAEFHTGMRVHIGASKDPGVTLAARTCAAKLSWEKQELIIANGVSQVDLDAFGVDLGDGIPVAAFQIKKSEGDCCVEYRIYSLQKPPRLLRSITGGEFFSASDVDLDGRVEIWTNDAAAVDGFERLTLRELDSAPIIVLRFAHGQLTDVSAEFQSYFDQDITRARDAIDPQDLKEFRNSDGKPAQISTPASAERLHRLRVVKTRILEIVWAYLYSGRDRDAWRALDEMWPATDRDRIRAAIIHIRAEGIHQQANVFASPAQGKKKHARIFDATSRQVAGRSLEVIPPQSILLEFPTAPEIRTSEGTEELLDLVIDAAGKVRLVEPAGKFKSIPPEQLAMARTWKFIPAFKDGHAVASRLRISVSPKR